MQTDTVLLKNPIVTYSDIDMCIEAFNSIASANQRRQISISATVKMDDVDILLIGYLVLFKRSLPDLYIRLELPHNNENIPFEAELSYKLKQIGTYACLVHGEPVFTLQYGDEEISFNWPASLRLPRNYFVLSNSFMLLLLIDGRQESNASLFDAVPELADDWMNDHMSRVSWSKKNDELYSALHDLIINNAEISKEKASNRLIDLTHLAFYKALSEAKVLSFYLDEEKAKDQKAQAGNLENEAYQYFKSVKGIFDELKDKPPVYSLIFSTFTSSDLLPNPLKNDTKNEYTERLKGLWAFTKDLVYGLSELVNNIREHAKPPLGIITARFIRKDVFKELENADIQGQQVYNRYKQNLAETGIGETNEFLCIHVADFGCKGIVRTLLDSSQQAIEDEEDEELKKVLQDDIDTIVSEHLTLKNLVDPDSELRLTQQSKRSIAHFGLLTFSKLITDNNGLLIVGSSDLENKSRETAVVLGAEIKDYNGIGIGTAFIIVLPINKNSFYASPIPQQLAFPMDSSAEEIESLEKLIEFSSLEWDRAKQYKIEGDKVIMNLRLSNRRVNNRKDEASLWREVQPEIAQMKKLFGEELEKLMVHVDLEQVEINGSQAMRFFGNWILHYPKIPLLVNNLPSARFQEMINVNKSVSPIIKGNKFWDNRSAIVIYNYVKPEKDKRFYFSDILWGNEFSDFMDLSSHIGKNHFNAAVLLFLENGTETKKPSKLNLGRHGAFYNQNLLLPLELILTNIDGKTIFEHNAYTLLTNHINNHEGSN